MTDALDILDQASAATPVSSAPAPVASTQATPDALDILDSASTPAPADKAPSMAQSLSNFNDKTDPFKVIPAVSSWLMSPLNKLIGSTYDVDKAQFTNAFPDTSQAIENGVSALTAPYKAAGNYISNAINNSSAAQAVVSGPVVQGFEATGKLAAALPILSGAGALGEASLGAAGDAASLAAPSVGSIANKLTGGIDADRAQLADLAIKKYGIDLNIPQVSGSAALNNVQKVSQELPFSGAKNLADTQVGQFNKALSNTIGENSENFTPQLMAQAKARMGQVYDTAYSGVPLQANDDFLNALSSADDFAKRSLPQDSYKTFNNEVTNILGSIGPDGTIPAQKVATLRSDLGDLGGSGGTLAKNYSNLKDSVDTILQSQLPPEKLTALQDTNRQYKNLKTIENLAAKSAEGSIDPSKLLNSVANSYDNFAYGGGGDIGELARIGKTFLPKLGGSDTVQKAIYAKALMGGAEGAGAAGAVMSGHVAALAKGSPILAANNIYQRAMNSPAAVSAYLAKNLPASAAAQTLGAIK